MKATKALVALSRIILETCYQLMAKDTDHRDLGPAYLNDYRRRDLDKDRIRRARNILEDNGYTVTPTTAA